MKTTQLSLLVASMLSLTFLSEIGFAATFAQKHPRRAEVNGRERRQDKRIAKDVKDGKITAAQGKQLATEEKGIKAQEVSEVKANGGYLTKGEQKQLNGELNGMNKEIKSDVAADKTGGTFAKEHPRRAEVNRRENRQDTRIANDVKDGKITAAQGQQLATEEKGIKAQEVSEVKANGGYLTKGEQKQLNGELNGMNKEISADKKADLPQ